MSRSSLRRLTAFIAVALQLEAVLPFHSPDPRAIEFELEPRESVSSVDASNSYVDGIPGVLAQCAQVEAFEKTCSSNCGRLSLWFLASRAGKLSPDFKGSSLQLADDDWMTISEILQEGKDLFQLRLAPRRLSSLKQVPADSILVLGQKHCVVLAGWQDERPIVFEPARVRMEVLNADSLADWSGVAIVRDDRLSGLFWGVLILVAAGAVVMTRHVLQIVSVRRRRHRSSAPAPGGGLD